MTAAPEVWRAASLFPHVEVHRVSRRGEHIERILPRIARVSGQGVKVRPKSMEENHTYHPEVVDGCLVVLKSLQQEASDAE